MKKKREREREKMENEVNRWGGIKIMGISRDRLKNEMDDLKGGRMDAVKVHSPTEKGFHGTQLSDVMRFL